MYIVHTFLDLAFLIQQYFMEIPPSYIFSLASVIYYKKSYDQPRPHIKKQRPYSASKGPSNQSYGFSSSHVWMWELDYKKAGCQRIDAFELRCWRRLLRVPWTARRSNQSILKEINPEHSLEGLMLKLKLQYFGHLMQRADSLERPWCWERLKANGDRAAEDEMAR